MNHINSILIEGRLVNEPIYENGRFSVAISSLKYDKETQRKVAVATISLHAYGKLGEICDMYLQVGHQIRILGHLYNTDTEVCIKAEHVDFKPAK